MPMTTLLHKALPLGSSRLRTAARAWPLAAGLFLVAGVLLALAAPRPALAHESHAGPLITFLSDNDALKEMLPADAALTRRKQALSPEGAAWAKSTLGVAVKPQMYEFILARDKSGGQVVGAVMLLDTEVEHGEARLAVGVDAQGGITRAAVLSVNRKYVPEVTGQAGRGFIPDLTGATVAQAASRAAMAKGEVGRSVFGQLRDMAAALAALLHTLES
ncbi:MAG: hypothetical protein OEW11_02975 [Nitrospirota bacterium]|nr:hypothetical protein [Nitrospirota bacterium]